MTQYDIEALQQLETLLGFKLPEVNRDLLVRSYFILILLYSQHPVDESTALLLLERVTVAQRESAHESKEFFDGAKRKKRVQDKDRRAGNESIDHSQKKTKKRKLAQLEDD